MTHNYFLTILTTLGLLGSAYPAYGLSLFTEEGRNGDRLRITKDSPQQRIESIRISPEILFIQVDDINKVNEQNTIKPDDLLINKILLTNKGIRINLKNPNFGFIQSENPNGDILLDIYPDSLGKRWKPNEQSQNLLYQVTGQVPPAPIVPTPSTPSTVVPTNTPPDIPPLVSNTATAPRIFTPNTVIPPNNTLNTNIPNTPTPNAATPLTPTPNTTSNISPSNNIPTPNISTPTISTPTISTPNTTGAMPSNSIPVPQQAQQNLSSNPSLTVPQNTITTPLNNQTLQQTLQQNVIPPTAPQQNTTANVNNENPNTTPVVQLNTIQNNTPRINEQQNPNNTSAQSQNQSIKNPFTDDTPIRFPLSKVSPADAVPIDLRQYAISRPPAVSSSVTPIPLTQPNQAPTNQIVQNTKLLTPTPPNLPNQNTPVTPTTSAPLNQVAQNTVLPVTTPLNQPNQNNQSTPSTMPVTPAIQPNDTTPPNQTVQNTTPPVPPIGNATPPQKTVTSSKTQLNYNLSDKGPLNTAPIEINAIDTNTKKPSNEISNTNTESVGEDIIPGEIVYVDEQGNTVAAPLDIPATIKAMREAKAQSDYTNALKAAKLLYNKPLPADITEEMLHTYLKSLFYVHEDELAIKGEEILTIAEEAININLESKLIPDAHTVLAHTNLAMNRVKDAKAHVDLMYKDYPYDPNTPFVMLLLGQYYYDKGDYALSSDYLQTLIEEYPDNKFAEDAAVLQGKSLYKQGFFDRTMALIEFTDRRWPRLYLTDLEYLEMRADIELRNKLDNDAIDTYWKIFNLDPKGEKGEYALDKIGHLYYKNKQIDAGRKIFEEIIQSFPTGQYTATAMRRLGENGLYDGNPTIEEIEKIFTAPNPGLPGIYYQKIIDQFPDTNEARTARLRQATQMLWEKKYADAAKHANAVYNDYIDKAEAPRAMDVLLRAFHPMLNMSITEKNYENTLALWQQYPIIQEYYTPIDPKLRMALGRGLLNRRHEADGEKMLSPFIDQTPTTKEARDFGLYTYNILLANALRAQNWNRILELSTKMEKWDLPKNIHLQRKYSTALAAENLGLSAKSFPIWQELAPNSDVPLYQRAYAQYFIARDAERKQNLRQAYQANLDALAMFEDLKTQQSPYANNERIRESVAALMDITEIAGRFTESLDWLGKYSFFVPPTSPDHAGLLLREARLHKKMGDTLRWRKLLEQVKTKEPNSVFGKMASSELRTFDIARDLNRFTGQ